MNDGATVFVYVSDTTLFAGVIVPAMLVVAPWPSSVSPDATLVCKVWFPLVRRSPFSGETTTFSVDDVFETEAAAIAAKPERDAFYRGLGM